MAIKIFLDDEREAPKGWVHVKWPDEVIKLLKIYQVAEISLDHDLGDDSRGTGYDVILWIENEVVLSGFEPPEIKIHSANASAALKMAAGVRSINTLYRLMQSSKEDEDDQ
jgi:hypothetical protein